MANYFRFWLMVPLVLGIVGFAEPRLQGAPIFGFAQAAILVAGIPYAAFIVCALLWSVKRESEDYGLAFLFAPFLFGLFVLLTPF